VSGRLLAIVVGVTILLGAAYATLTIHNEKVAHFQRAAALRQTLATMRKAIRDFRAREGRYPRTLQELVPKYMRVIPVDPVTGSANLWRVTTEETVQPSSDFSSSAAPAKTETYIIDVHSGASGLDANGNPFAEY
jgi:general secretion pathway protein G